MSIQELRSILGKQKAIIVGKTTVLGPSDQLMLLFDDDTHFESFGIILGWSSRVCRSDRGAAMKSIYQIPITNNRRLATNDQ